MSDADWIRDAQEAIDALEVDGRLSRVEAVGVKEVEVNVYEVTLKDSPTLLVRVFPGHSFKNCVRVALLERASITSHD